MPGRVDFRTIPVTVKIRNHFEHEGHIMQPWRNLTSVLFLVSLPLATSLGVCRAEREPDSYSREARARFDQGTELQKKGQWLEAIRAFDDAERGGMKDFPRLHL